MIGEEDCEIPETQLEPNLSLVAPNDVPSRYRDVPIDDVCVFVDPLDATKEYTLGNLEAVCTLIGISFKGEAVGKTCNGTMMKETVRANKLSDFDGSSYLYCSAGVMCQPFVGDGRLVWAIVGGPVKGATIPQRQSNHPFTVAVTRTHGSLELEVGRSKKPPTYNRLKNSSITFIGSIVSFKG
jgi:fructose-1,6-bisphosphatase/inositol monophosphatase family enzyme